jgi:hypothetical protein
MHDSTSDGEFGVLAERSATLAQRRHRDYNGVRQDES